MTAIKGPAGTFEAEGAVADYWLAQRGYERAVTPDQAEELAGELKGEALDAELDRLGLSHDGTADEKRERVAGALANTNTLED